ncbi:Copine-domain-containing protein [Scenedesmus sp. NREL 46B-D3]|nr:Copine-domain-containing protein [Scenedesmus sp. NREL 46B-D3]
MGSSHSSASNRCSVNRSSTSRFKVISDQYTSLDQVQGALRKEGLESCNLIVAVDCTKSNEWTGKESFFGRCLHHLGPNPNPYEEAMIIIGRTLASFDDDHLIPAYGFGDASCQDGRVFSFNPLDAPCQGLEAVVWRYRQLLPSVRLAGPTSFAPAIRQACKLVNDSGGRFHILLIIADGQVTRSSDLEPGQHSPQEAATIAALVEASGLPLSVVMVGVGDGPWEVMQHFDDALPQRAFDNFQFVNFTEIMARCGADAGRRQAQFALRALMEVPEQFRTIQRLQLLGRQQPLQQPCPPPLDPPGPAAAAAPAGYTLPQYQQQHQHQQHQQPKQCQAGAWVWRCQHKPVPAINSSISSSSRNRDTNGSNCLSSIHIQWYHHPAAAAAAVPAIDPLANPMFLCPITQDVMGEPVLAADGYTYEKHAIQDWLSRNDRSPMTNEALGSKQLLPNHALRSAIMEAQHAAAAGTRR